MTVSKDTREKQFTEILHNISEFGMSWKTALKGVMSSNDFNNMIDSDKEKQKRYVRACEQRADFMAEETLKISDALDNDVIEIDGKQVVNNNVINRDRLRVDTRKWLLSKMHPKKYGDKISQEITGANGKDLIPPTFNFKNLNEK